MNIIAFNGSPRKGWNTEILLKNALEGAASKGATTGLVHLYDLTYKGCISCFACKEKGGASYGRCAVRDALTPVLAKAAEADALVFGSPIYLAGLTGGMQSFLERLVFPYLTYTDPPGSLFPKKIRTGFIYTMGATGKAAEEIGYLRRFDLMERMYTRIFGASEKMISSDTYQFEDYSKVVAPRFDPQEKLKRRKEVFPLDCRKAFEMGVRLASPPASP